MKKIIFYHNDIDGVISAAALIRLKKFNLDNIVLRPVKSSERGMFDSIVKNARSAYDYIASVDYAFSPGLDFWCDHHHSPELGDMNISGDHMIHDVTSKSAASLLISKMLREIPDTFFKKKYIKLLKELSENIDMIDSCGYDNVDYFFESKAPHMTIMRKILIDSNDINSVVEAVLKCDFNLKKVVKVLKADPSYYLRKQNENSNSGGFLDRGGMTVHIAAEEKYTPTRYTEFYTYPDIFFSVRVVVNDDDETCTVRVSKNPWNKKSTESINLSTIFKGMYPLRSWGGHRDVSGGMITKNHLADFLKISERMLKSIMDGEYDV